MEMQAATNSKQFYFINKSEKSTHLSQNLPHEKAAVQRYVQTGRKRGRKHVKAKTESHSTSQLLESNGAHKLTCSGLQDSGLQVDRADATYPDSQSRKNCKCSHFDHSNAVQGTKNLATPLSCQSVLCKQDPFDASSVPIDKSVAGLLHYYLFYYHPSQWPNEMTLLRHGVYIYQDSVLSLMKTAIANKLAMCCLLGAAACRLQFIDRLPCALVSGKESFYIHMALQLLASYIPTANLQDPEQLEQCLQHMIFLNSAEAYRDNNAGAKAHLDGARQVLGPMGGLAAVKDEGLRGQIAMADLYLSCVELRPCFFDCVYDPGPASLLGLSELEMHALSATSTASSLLNRPESFLPLELRMIVEELRESHTVKTSISTSSMSSLRAMKITHWISLRNMAVRNKLLAIERPDPVTHSIRTAMIMWSYLSMSITGRAKTIKVMAPSLKSVLSEILPLDWANNEDVKLWIILVGLYCAGEGSAEFDWFMSEYRNLSNLYTVLDAATASTSHLAQRLEEFQRTFFFDVSVQQSRTWALAEKIRHKNAGIG